MQEVKGALIAATNKDVAELIWATMQEQARDLDENIGAQTEWQKVIDATLDKSLDMITVSAETVRDEIREIVQTYKEQGADIVAEKLDGKFDEITTSRAENIAETSCTNAQGKSSVAMHKELGYDSMWLNLHVSRNPRKNHLASPPNRTVAKHGLFRFSTLEGSEVMMEHPGDGSHGASAQDICRCKCKVKGVRR